MNVRDSIKKVSALAGSTLMIGLSLGTAASLADFPGQFTNNQGTPTAEIVVGSQGAVSDVVGAIEIGAALGQSSLRVGQVRDTKTVEVAGASSWSTDGTTLDTRNDDLYFGDTISDVRQTLTADDLDALATTTFQDASGTSQDIEQYLYVGDRASGFGNPGDTSNQDPFLYVDNPSTVSDTSYLYKLQANVGDGLELSDTSQGDNKNDDVLGEDLSLFGKSFTISEDSFTSGNEGEFILYGSSQEYDLETGESTEFEVNGETHTVEVRAVTSSNTTAFYLDGSLREKTEGSTVNVDGTDVRIADVIQTSSQNSEGLVTFAVGSEEYVLRDGEAIEDSDGNDIEGTYVNLEGSSVGSTNTLADGVKVSSVEVSVGAPDSDTTYVRAGESFQDPVFDDIVFRHGGLLPDAGAEDATGVESVTFSQGDSDTASVTFTPRGQDQMSVSFFYRDTNTGSNMLADADGDTVVVVEGDAVQKDQYFTADAGGFPNLFEVTGIDTDEQNLVVNGASTDEATVDLRDRLSGSTIELDLDANGDGNTAENDNEYEGEEVIDGQTYHFVLDTGGGTGTADKLYVTWGTDADFKATGSGASGVTSVSPSFETENGGLLSLYDPSQDPSDFGTNLVSFNSNEEFYDAAGQTDEGANGFGDGDDIVRDIGGQGTYSTGADTNLNSGNDGTVDSSNRDTLNALSGITGGTYYLISGDSTINAGEDVITDDDSDGLYTAEADASVAGDSLSNTNGKSLTGTKPTGWANISFYNESTGTVGWEHTEDAVILENQTGGTQGGIYNSQDQVLNGTTPATDATLSSGSPSDWANIKFNDSTSGGNWDGTSDVVIEDLGGSGTVSNSSDSPVNANGDGVSASDGAAIVDLSTASGGQWVDVDGNSGYDAGDEIFSDDDGDGVYTSQADTLIDNTDSTTDVNAGNTLTAFASSTKHDESQNSNSQFDIGENVIDDVDGSGDFSSDDTVLYGSLKRTSGLQYWSSDTSEVSGVSSLQSYLPDTDPAAVFIQEEDDTDTQKAFVVEPAWDGTDSEVEVGGSDTADALSYTGTWSRVNLESNDDVYVSYNDYGTYASEDTGDTGTVELMYPSDQSTLGTAFTGAGDGLARSASGTQQARFEYRGVKNNRIRGRLPAFASMDTEITDQQRTSRNMILVGGPAVNQLVADLAAQNDAVWTQDQWQDREGEAVLQMVEDAFSEGTNALIVAGHSAEDTVRAARYISDWKDHRSSLRGEMTYQPE